MNMIEHEVKILAQNAVRAMHMARDARIDGDEISAEELFADAMHYAERAGALASVHCLEAPQQLIDHPALLEQFTEATLDDYDGATLH